MIRTRPSARNEAPLATTERPSAESPASGRAGGPPRDTDSDTFVRSAASGSTHPAWTAGLEGGGARIGRMVMSSPTNAIQLGYVAGMAKVAAREGFTLAIQTGPGEDPAAIAASLLARAPELGPLDALRERLEFIQTTTPGYEWAEDNKWIAGDGTVVSLPAVSMDAMYAARTFATANLGLQPGAPGYALEGVHTAGLPAGDPEGVIAESAFQGAVAMRGEETSAAALGAAVGRARVARTYNEGGNLLVGTSRDGEPYALAGRDGLLISTFHLDEVRRSRPEEVPELSDAEVAARTDLLEAAGALEPHAVEQTAARLAAAGQLSMGATPALRQAAARAFLAKMDLTADIMAHDIGVPRERLAILPQPDFHLDMHMRPLGPGQVLLDDPRANVALLDEALARAPQGSWEVAELRSMRAREVAEAPVMQPVHDAIEAQLQKLDLEVLRAPGVMQTWNPLGHDRHVNFMNAVPGTNPVTGERFYATNATSLPSLRTVYEDRLDALGIRNVYWIGDQGGGPTSMSEAERSLQRMGGLDCRENH